MSYFHNRFNSVDRVAIYQFIKHLEDIVDCISPNSYPLGWIYRDEFVKLRQIINFAYTHGFRDDNV